VVIDFETVSRQDINIFFVAEINKIMSEVAYRLNLLDAESVNVVVILII